MRKVWYEADQRHAEIIVDMMELGEMNVRAEVPREKLSSEEKDEEKLAPEETKRYQALVARANYLTQDRSDIQFCVKELARDMSAPSRRSWRPLIKLGKYLKSHPRSRYLHGYQENPGKITVWTDTDYA